MLLCQLPAAAKLGHAAVAQLLRYSIRWGSAGFVELLCTLPAAEQFGVNDLVDMLEAAAQLEDDAPLQLHSALIQFASGKVSY
jgi:hypothetical protein